MLRATETSDRPSCGVEDGLETVEQRGREVVELLKTKCLPVLLYGLEVCSLSKAQTRSLD